MALIQFMRHQSPQNEPCVIGHTSELSREGTNARQEATGRATMRHRPELTFKPPYTKKLSAFPTSVSEELLPHWRLSTN